METQSPLDNDPRFHEAPAPGAQMPGVVCTSEVGEHEFLRRGREIAAARQISLGAALSEVCRIYPHVYADYRDKTCRADRQRAATQTRVPAGTAIAAAREDHPFAARARARAAAERISVEAAKRQLARDDPELYRSYRDTFRQPHGGR